MFLLLDFLSWDESNRLYDESEDDGSDSESAGMCDFSFHFNYSVGRVRGVDSGVFVPIGVNSNFDVVPLVVFVQIGVKSKGGRLIEIFWRPKS